MSRSFDDLYARYYDFIYYEKDYEKECSFLEKVFRRYSISPIERVLDISCGSGGHAIPLAGRGYLVTGLDSSIPMIEAARAKTAASPRILDFRVAKMNRFSLSNKYDCSISMFDSIDYLRTEDEVVDTFRTVGRHLKPRGIFVVQFWNGHAVLRLKPKRRRKTVEREGLKLVRTSVPLLITEEDTCLIRYHVKVLNAKGVVADFREEHFVRYFFPERIKELLAQTGYETLGVFRPFDLNQSADDNDWSIVLVARFG